MAYRVTPFMGGSFNGRYLWTDISKTHVTICRCETPDSCGWQERYEIRPVNGAVVAIFDGYQNGRPPRRFNNHTTPQSRR